jgi:hypothetical protein
MRNEFDGSRDDGVPMTEQIERLEVRVRALEVALETAIVWIAQSAVGVLSPDNAGRILETMRGTVNGKS